MTKSLTARPVRLASAAVVMVAMASTLGAGGRTPGPAAAVASDGQTIAHVLNRIGFGPRPGDVERVHSMGLAAYLEQQLYPERILEDRLEARLGAFKTLGMSSRDLALNYARPLVQARLQAQRTGRGATPGDPSMRPGEPPVPDPKLAELRRRQNQVVLELAEQKIIRAVESARQLQEVLVDFWFNHFNVFAGKGQVRILATAYERDTIRPHILGRFRTLLGATAKAPAMLVYLDNWQSVDPEAAARLESIRRLGPRFGLIRPGGLPLGPGTRGAMPRPGQNPPPLQRARGLNENYARELLELHTLGVDGGYTQKDVQEVARAFTGWTITRPEQGLAFRFEPRLHDAREKVVLGHTIKAGGGIEDGEQVLDILARHPSTATFIATKLVRRLVADDPPASLVSRAAETFRRTDGDLREVVRTIITSAEFLAPGARRAKIKTPFEFVVSAIRATGAEVLSARQAIQALREMGMPLYFCQPPTGYADDADAWVSAGALLHRLNFAQSLASGELRGITPNLDQTASPDVPGWRDRILTDLLQGEVSPATRATLAKATGTVQVLTLALGSPEFQRR